jgi:NADH-quinone oxidoreductase subunit H
VNALRSWLQTTPMGQGMDPELLSGVSMLIFATLVLVGVALAALVFTWAERKIAGYIQSRYGPMYTGPGNFHGLLQPIADGVKLLLKEDIWPADADKLLFRLGPLLVFTGAFMSFVVLPFSPTWVGANLDMGLLYIFATSSLVVTGVLAAGWGSNNKWSLYGAMRGAAQVISYEIPLALAVLPIVMSVGSLNMGAIVEAQGGWVWQWNLFGSFGLFAVAFLIYMVSSLAEVNRVPFDLPETESELVSGYHVEYTGMKFAFFFLGEYADMFVVSAIAVTVFLGGWYTGVPALDNILHPALIFIGKSVLLVMVQIWLRWTLPRLRVDQLMFVCWKIFIPATLGLVFLYGLGRVVLR